MRNMAVNDSYALGNWRRWLIEGLVIISSILLAFAIDAAWEINRQRQEENEILDGLQREFEGYRDYIINGALVNHTEMMSAMEALLVSIETGSWSSTELSLDQAIGKTLIPPTSDLRFGFRDALVQSGRLELIRDRPLREKLANWPRYYDELSDDEEIGRKLVVENIIPHLAEGGYNLAEAMIELGFTNEWPVNRRSISEDRNAAQGLLSDPEFRALIEVRYSMWNHAKGEYQAALKAVEDILLDMERIGVEER